MLLYRGVESCAAPESRSQLGRSEVTLSFEETDEDEARLVVTATDVPREDKFGNGRQLENYEAG